MHDHDSAHAHEQVFLGDAHDRHEKRTRYVVVLTAAMMLVEIVAGWLTGSMALLADGFHMATHAGALGVAAWAYGYARRHARSPRFTFGTGKIGDLAGFASALALAMIALGIAAESVRRLIDPTNIAYAEAIWIAVLGLAVNLASAWLLGHGDHGQPHPDRHDHHHEQGGRPRRMCGAFSPDVRCVLAVAASSSTLAHSSSIAAPTLHLRERRRRGGGPLQTE